MRFRLLVCIVMVGLVRSSYGAENDTLAVRADIRVAADELRAHHPKLLQPKVREVFDRSTNAVLALPNSVSRGELIMRWAESIAMLHDGHTQLLVTDAHAGLHQYPLRLYWFEEGLFVTDAARQFDQVIGERLLSINEVPIDEIVKRVRPFVHGDNEMAVRDILPSRLVLQEVLDSTAVTRQDPARFRFEHATVRLTAVPVGSSIDWVHAVDRLATVPLYLKHPRTPYWFQYLPDEHTMYVQYNSVENDPDQPFEAFCANLFAAVDETHAQRLVLDLRRNNGGDNTLIRPLVVGLIRSRLNERGHLFVIIGRLTFSAAVNLAAQLEHFTNATFVGEPTEAPPNHYGETRVVKLPNTGIILLHSTLFWESAGDAKDTRPWIPPAIAAPPRAASYFSGRDDALDSIRVLH